MTERISWVTRQYLSAILACCGFLAMCFSGVIAWNYKELAAEVRKVPVIDQKVTEFQEHRKMADSFLRDLQTILSSKSTSQAVLEERLGSVDKRLITIESQLQQLLYSRSITPRKEASEERQTH